MMNFHEYQIPYNWNSDRIEGEVDAMVALMNQHEIPEPNECCKNFAYSEQYARPIHQKSINQEQDLQRSLFG
ncbi:hypothetical protein [Prochlorococcus sp. MIT 1300]|uniref:hypothetical protein n=1 Tax=Prochlorococcus sp. MIT 1300 TaxID=3096218 RepID=UPI002A756C51|nr:hypothetical protein [Prochlorococcus sp. MIT 1300]